MFRRGSSGGVSTAGRVVLVSLTPAKNTKTLRWPKQCTLYTKGLRLAKATSGRGGMAQTTRSPI